MTRMLYCLAAITLSLPNFAKAEAVPYTAEVMARRAIVRGGAGSLYYATTDLPLGTFVEVYRVDKEGWLAIRPPAGSFSWVAFEKLKETDQPNVMEAIEDDVPVWVGSHGEQPGQLYSQLELRRGERVEVLGRKQRISATDGSRSKWYMIAPPAGEFRWVRKSDVHAVQPSEADAESRPEPVRASPVLTPRPATTEQPAPAQQPTLADNQPTSVLVKSTAETAPAPTPASQPTAATESVEAPPENQVTWRQRSVVASSTVGNTGPGVSGDSEPAAVSQTEPVAAETVRVAAIAETAAVSETMSSDTPVPSRLSSKPAEALRQLEVALSQMAAVDVSRWNVDALQQQTDQIVARTTDLNLLRKVDALSTRLKEFATLKSQFENSDLSGSSSVPIAATTPAISNQPVGTGVALASSTTPSPSGPQYDVSGWLLPAYSNKRSVPPYAITDRQGNVLSYVSPSPGLNLHRYLRKEVGVLGQRGYVPALRTPHLTAKRIIELRRHR